MQGQCLQCYCGQKSRAWIRRTLWGGPAKLNCGEDVGGETDFPVVPTGPRWGACGGTSHRATTRLDRVWTWGCGLVIAHDSQISSSNESDNPVGIKPDIGVDWPMDLTYAVIALLTVVSFGSQVTTIYRRLPNNLRDHRTTCPPHTPRSEKR